MEVDGDQAHDLLRCDEHFPSSPGLPTSDSYMEYGTQSCKKESILSSSLKFYMQGHSKKSQGPRQKLCVQDKIHPYCFYRN